MCVIPPNLFCPQAALFIAKCLTIGHPKEIILRVDVSVVQKTTNKGDREEHACDRTIVLNCFILRNPSVSSLKLSVPPRSQSRACNSEM